jgi:hypothetical protein
MTLASHWSESESSMEIKQRLSGPRVPAVCAIVYDHFIALAKQTHSGGGDPMRKMFDQGAQGKVNAARRDALSNQTFRLAEQHQVLKAEEKLPGFVARRGNQARAEVGTESRDADSEYPANLANRVHLDGTIQRVGRIRVRQVETSFLPNFPLFNRSVLKVQPALER